MLDTCPAYSTVISVSQWVHKDNIKDYSALLPSLIVHFKIQRKIVMTSTICCEIQVVRVLHHMNRCKWRFSLELSWSCLQSLTIGGGMIKMLATQVVNLVTGIDLKPQWRRLWELPLQHVMNAAARVMNLSLRDHVKPALKQLRWLPVVQRITYNLCLFMHFIRVRQDLHRPQYLSDCVSAVSAANGRYRMRSTGSSVYFLPRT